MNLNNVTAVSLASKLKNKELYVRDVVQQYIDNINRQDKDINAYITVEADRALEKARIIQNKIDNDEELGHLAGVPIAIKDNICTKDMKTTCGSKILENFVPTYSATVIDNLEKAGCIILGKTNMDEFAMGCTTETSYYGITRNPHNKEHVPGGSSGGSAAAVAANECIFSLGSDTGGSIRQPSAYCNVVGMKPTYGTVSRYGLIAFASSLDQIGPLAKNVTDLAYIMETISSYDKKDSTSVMRKRYDFSSALKEDVKGMKVAIPVNYLDDNLDEDIKNAIFNAAEILKEKGAIVEEIELKLMDYALSAYYTISSAEASSNLARYDGVKYGYRADGYNGLHEMYKKTRSEGFGNEVKRRILLGTFVLSSGYYDAYYLKALKTRALIKKEFDEVFLKYDVILSPVTPSSAPILGTSLVEPLKMYSGDVYTIAANLAGIPALSLPMGMDKKGMPIAVQFLAGNYEENKIINAAHVCETGRKNI